MTKLPDKIKNILTEEIEILYTLRRQIDLKIINKDSMKNIDQIIGNLILILAEYYGATEINEVADEMNGRR